MKTLLFTVLFSFLLSQNEVCFEIENNPNPNSPSLGCFTKYVSVLDCFEIYAESSIQDNKVLHAAAIAAGEADAAAIGSVLAGEIYEVNPVFENIQDRSENITRFLVLGSEASLPTGEDRTTIMFITAHTPGALVDVLHDFRTRGINLSHIDKRPSGRTNWEYTFFIDVDVHREDPAMQEALAQAEQHCRVLKVLGSYPRAAGII